MSNVLDTLMRARPLMASAKTWARHQTMTDGEFNPLNTSAARQRFLLGEPLRACATGACQVAAGTLDASVPAIAALDLQAQLMFGMAAWEVNDYLGRKQALSVFDAAIAAEQALAEDRADLRELVPA